MSTYAIGDLQGCYEPLAKLLDKVNFDPAQDRLWAVGDLVNRGPQSLATLRFLKSLGTTFTSVQGNHDLHLLALATGAAPEGKKKYLEQILNAPDCHELCEWLRMFPLLHYEQLPTDCGNEKFVMVHAGLAPAWSLQQARNYADEVNQALHSDDFLIFLKGMYGDKPDLWNENLVDIERLRILTNYFTRMRFCDELGTLNLRVKTGIETAPEGYKPWYQWQQLNTQLTILFGHWAALDGITNTPNIYALDTGCVWGRCLTMLRLEDKRSFCIDCG